MKHRFSSSGLGRAPIVFCLSLLSPSVRRASLRLTAAAVFGLLLCPAFAPLQALAAGQTIIIDVDPAADVFGNGDATRQGAGPPTKDPNNNTVIINSNVTGGFVFGAQVAGAANDVAATGNRVVVNNGTVDNWVVGGYASTTAGGSATATGNTVTISGGTLITDVNGGRASSSTGTATATGNSVVISGGTVNGHVYGGYASAGLPGSATATHNTVTISGSPTFGVNTILYGGQTQGAGAGDAFTGNTLNVLGVSGLQVAAIRNFQNYNFTLPSSVTPGMTMVHSTNPVLLNQNGGVNITLKGSLPGGGGQRFFPGSKVTLIDNTQGQPASMTAEPVRQGVAMLYTFSLSADDVNGLVATATSAQAAPEAKSLSEGRAATGAVVNQGMDHVVGNGMQAAGAASTVGGTNFGVFASAGGGVSTYHTGSHVDVRGASLIAGIAWKPELAYGKFLLAPFFEAGWGGYNSYNSFSGSDVNGKGNISSYGGGLLLRYELPIGLYFEASGRMGGVRTDYSSSDLRDVNNRKAEYDIHNAYYGLHAGLGYIWNFNEKASLDLYAKYLWSHQEGQSVSVCGDTIKFKDMNSHRLRGGARFTYAINEHVSPYIGAAYEQEFDGRARATVYGNKIGTPDLMGGTGIGELGLNLKPSKTLPLSFDLGVQGYVGKREGVTGSLQARWEF